MKVYFLSSIPCALRVNGLHFGCTDRFERFADVCLSDELFVEFLSEKRGTISFFLTERIRFSPPKGCAVYLLEDAIAVYARDFPPTDFTLRVHAQERCGDTLSTLFSQGELQLSLERSGELFLARLPPAFSIAKLTAAQDFWLLTTKDELLLVNARAEICLIERFLSYELSENELHALLPLSGGVADCVWQLSGNEPTRTRCLFRSCETETDVPDELRPVLFFESLLNGLNCDDFLSDELRSEKDGLRAFLGDYEGVVQTNEPNRFGLLRKKAENLYEAAYFTVKTEKGKISDITTEIAPSRA